MFDAKSLLEQIVGGSNRSAAPSQGSGGGGLADILGQVLGGGAQQGGGRPGAPAASSNPLEDLLRNLAPGASPRSDAGVPSSQPDTGGGIGDILGQLQKQLGGGQGAGSGGGGIMDILTQVLGQATQGTREGAGRISDATGAGAAARDVLGRSTGQTPEDMIAKLKELIANNQLGAGAALGGLGGLILGTQTGRGLAVGAAKVGALALIGGLAYKAYQNYQAGKPLITGPHAAEAAPQGTGYEPQALTNQSATLYIRAMIAAANADGRIDSSERERIFGALKQGGLEAEAEAFIQHELGQPASIDELAEGISSQEEAVQVYTAARIAIDPDTSGESAFLAALASRLGIDRQLASMIDHEARTTTA